MSATTWPTGIRASSPGKKHYQAHYNALKPKAFITMNSSTLLVIWNKVRRATDSKTVKPLTLIPYSLCGERHKKKLTSVYQAKFSLKENLMHFYAEKFWCNTIDVMFFIVVRHIAKWRHMSPSVHFAPAKKFTRTFGKFLSCTWAAVSGWKGNQSFLRGTDKSPNFSNDGSF